MFLSLPFIILFTCCLILYYTVKGNYQKPVLLLASCIFIGYFNIAYLLIAALIAAITFYWGRWIGMQEQENKRRRVFIGGIVFLVLLTRGSGELTAYYKDVVISRLVSGLCPGATYNPTQGIPRQTFVASSLFSTAPDRYSCEDHIAGCLDRTAFSCSEIHAEEKRVTRDSKGRTRTHWVTIFRGFFFIADFHKDFRGQTVVHRNSWIKFDFSNRRVKLENPAFEKRFDVYSTDQVEARYLLTPSMMEKLVALDDKFPGKITLSFTGSKVIVAIPDAMDHFETSIWKHQVQNDDIRREFSTLAALLGIVDDLNLNLRIWSKQ